MIAIRILCLLLCKCFYFVIVNSQSTVDETSAQCPWNNDEYVLQTFERTSKPTQQLLHRHEQLLKQMKQSVDNMSAQLMSIKNQQSSTRDRDADDKQQFVSALTGKSVCKPLNIRGLERPNSAGQQKWEGA